MICGGVMDSGARIYDEHPARELTLTVKEILDLLTGYDRSKGEYSGEPHPVWKQIMEASATIKRPDGIKATQKLLSLAKCK